MANKDNIEDANTNQAEDVAPGKAAAKTYKATLTQCIKFEDKPYKVGEDITISEDKVDILKPYATIKEEV